MWWEFCFGFVLLGGDGSYGPIGWCDVKVEGQKIEQGEKIGKINLILIYHFFVCLFG